MIGLRRSIALLVLGFYVTQFAMTAWLGPDEIFACYLGLALCYGLAFIGLGAAVEHAVDLVDVVKRVGRRGSCGAGRLGRLRGRGGWGGRGGAAPIGVAGCAGNAQAGGEDQSEEPGGA